MRLKNLKFLMMFAAVAMLLAHASCIKENMDDCPPEFNVRVLVEADADINAAYPERYGNVTSVSVYAFDSDGKFVTSKSGGSFTAGKEYSVPFSLPSGNFSFVVRTNLTSPYYRISHTDAQLQSVLISNVSTYLDAAAFSGREITDDINNTHSGLKQNNEVIFNKESTIIIPIVPHTYKINFVVEGLSADNNPNDFVFKVTDNDFQYNFNNVKSPRGGTTGAAYTYTRTDNFTANKKTIAASMMVLGLEDPVHTPSFVFSRKNATATPTQLYPATGQADLIYLIREAYKAQTGNYPDFNKIFEFTIPFRFTVDMGVTLDLNYWDSIENPTYL